MACYRPLKGWRAKRGYDKVKKTWPIVFNIQDGYVDQPVEVPCGKCIGCKLEKSKQWALRCCNEAQMHEKNCYLTLTYDDDNLPKDRSINVRDPQLFIKRMRKRFGELRYFLCGEYGEECGNCGVNNKQHGYLGCDDYKEALGRPHYHAIIFGFDFDDRTLFKQAKTGNLYTSDILERVWKKGQCSIGDVTFESSAYVARYITKKITGPDSEEWYQGRKKEFIVMSKKPPIGATWLEKFKDDVYPHDYVVIRGGIKVKPPRSYDNLLLDPENMGDYHALKSKRRRDAFARSEDNTGDRLRDREIVKTAQTQSLKRRTI